MSIQSVPGLYFALYSKDCTFMLFENCKTSMPNRNQEHFGTKTIEPQHCCQDASRHRLQTACSTWPKRHRKGIKFNPSYRFHQISCPFSPFSLYEPTVQLPVYVGRMILGKNCARLPAGPVCFFCAERMAYLQVCLKVWIKKTCGAIGRRRRVPAACHKIWEHTPLADCQTMAERPFSQVSEEALAKWVQAHLESIRKSVSLDLKGWSHFNCLLPKQLDTISSASAILKWDLENSLSNSCREALSEVE